MDYNCSYAGARDWSLRMSATRREESDDLKKLETGLMELKVHS